jgi:hypothetical protein
MIEMRTCAAAVPRRGPYEVVSGIVCHGSWGSPVLAAKVFGGACWSHKLYVTMVSTIAESDGKVSARCCGPRIPVTGAVA